MNRYNNKETGYFHLGLAFVLIVLAIMSRLIPHIPNFTSLMAVAIFAGVYVSDKRLALVIPIAAMLITDLLIGFHITVLPVYLSFFIMVWVGFQVRKKISIPKILLSSISGSILFYIVTNFYFWLFANYYPLTYSGLVDCYIRAIPFFRTAFLGDMSYTVVLFGSYYLITRYLPYFKTRNSEA